MTHIVRVKWPMKKVTQCCAWGLASIQICLDRRTLLKITRVTDVDMHVSFTGSMACSHDSTTVLRPIGKWTNKAFKIIMTTYWLLDDWWVYLQDWVASTCWVLSKCMRSTWSLVYDLLQSYNVENIQCRNDCRPSWAQLCCFDPFIIVVEKSCCHVNSTLPCITLWKADSSLAFSKLETTLVTKKLVK